MKKFLVRLVSFIYSKGKKVNCPNCGQEYCHCWLTKGALFLMTNWEEGYNFCRLETLKKIDESE